tara:strand:- start:8801 stop:9664 length:864 start_codon:yes stop_codon:yes gene_type:complete
LDRTTLKRINVLLVGQGKWASNYVRTILAHKACNLSSHLGSRKLLAQLEKDNQFLNNLLENQQIELIVIAIHPSYQKLILEGIKKFDGQIILEKPLINKKSHINFYEKLNLSIKNKIVVNHSHFFSMSFLKTLKDIKRLCPEKMYIKDYGNGPYRDGISPLMDWGPHAFGICYYLNSSLEIVDLKKVSQKKSEKWLFKLKGNNIRDIKIITGNGFPRRNRSVVFFSKSMSILKFELDKTEEVESPMSKILSDAIDRIRHKKSDMGVHFTFNLALMASKALLEIKNID